jgi:hypothetical protein
MIFLLENHKNVFYINILLLYNFIVSLNLLGLPKKLIFLLRIEIERILIYFSWFSNNFIIGWGEQGML